MKASDILGTASKLVGGDREATHGDKTKNHDAIAAVWNGILAARAIWAGNVPIDAHTAAQMMVGLKIARSFGGRYNPDDYIDQAGYCSVAGEIRAKAELARIAPAITLPPDNDPDGCCCDDDDGA